MDLLSQHEAFLRAIFDAPDDDTARLVYADFLDENGNERRAKLIRVQCELADLGPPDVPSGDPERRFALLTQQALLTPPRRGPERWDRGFLDPYYGATVDGTDLADPLAFRWKIVTEFPEWFGAPYLRVTARPPLDAARIDVLLSLPAFARVTTLNLSGSENAEDGGGEGILAVYQIHPTIGPGGVVALAAHKALRRVTELDLTNNDLDNDAARALMKSPYLDNLKRLNLLYGNRFRGKVWQQVIERFGEDVVGGEENDPIPF